MNLTHEYNDDLIGYVVTDLDTGIACNFQLDQDYSNHPQPVFRLTYGCQGDNSYRDFTEEELRRMNDYLHSFPEVIKKLKEFNLEMYGEE